MSTLAQLKYGYYQASNRLYRRDEVARSSGAGFDELYGYDGLQLLTSMQRGTLNGTNTGLSSGPTLTQSWSLDQTGNWSGFNQTVQDALTQSRTHNTVNEITGISETVGLPWDTPAYDANGNMTSLPQPESLDESFTATWDAWNRLVKLEDTSGTVAEYEYDGLNRRIAKTTGSTTRRAYYSDQWQVLEERVGASSSAESQYLWGIRYVDDLVLRDRGSERLYSLSDALFNVVALTDATGAVKERFAYQPYGQSEALNPNFTNYTGSDYLWTYRFTGRELDLESGLQLNRNRYLHQQLGRWISRDPIGYLDGLNLYAYANSLSVPLLDPSGFSPTIKYIPDRGRWTFFTIEDRRDEEGELYGVGASMQLNWYSDPADFASKDCCLCDEMGFIQVVKQKIIMGNDHDWIVDKDIPYPFGQTKNPCAEPFSVTLKMSDTPGFTAYINTITYFKQAFEVCMVCLDGQEKGAVYGCLTWGHEYNWVTTGFLKGKYSAYRWGGGVLKGGVFGGEPEAAFTLQTKDLHVSEPSEFWKNAVRAEGWP